MVIKTIFTLILGLSQCKSFTRSNSIYSEDLINFEDLEEQIRFDPAEEYLAAENYFQELNNEDALTNLRASGSSTKQTDDILNKIIKYQTKDPWMVIEEGKDTFDQLQIQEMKRRQAVVDKEFHRSEQVIKYLEEGDMVKAQKRFQLDNQELNQSDFIYLPKTLIEYRIQWQIKYDYHQILMVREKVKYFKEINASQDVEWQMYEDVIKGKWSHDYINAGVAHIALQKDHAALLAQFVSIEKTSIQKAIENLKRYDLTKEKFKATWLPNQAQRKLHEIDSQIAKIDQNLIKLENYIDFLEETLQTWDDTKTGIGMKYRQSEEAYQKLINSKNLTPFRLVITICVCGFIFALCVPFILRGLRYNKDTAKDLKKQKDEYRLQQGGHKK